MKQEEDTTTPEKTLAIQFPGSLRDWFAGQALPSIIEGARKILIATEQMPSADRMAHAAYVLADSMLAERAKA